MSGRRTAAITILGVWALALAWHVRREYFAPELERIRAAAAGFGPGTYFYRLAMEDAPIGQATSRLDTLAGGFVLDDQMAVVFPALGREGAATVRTRVFVTRSLALDSFTYTLDSDIGRYRARGFVETDSTLRVVHDEGGAASETSFPLREPPILDPVRLIRLAASGGLEVGRVARIEVLETYPPALRTVEIAIEEHDTLMVADSVGTDPASGALVPLRYDTVPAWKVSETRGGVTMVTWVDEEGRTVRATEELGFSIERTAAELALDAYQRARDGGGGGIDEDLILRTAIQSNVDLGAAPDAASLSFRLTGVDLEGFDLDGGRQRLRGDTLVVRREGVEGLRPGYTLPYPMMDLADALRPEPLVQSDDPGIRREARRMAGLDDARGGADPVEVARRLVEGVYGYLEKSIAFSVPNARQVLEARRGDCNEHTVLYVAMARSLGLPARTAVGLVHLDGLFYYHAWPEVWLGEWVAVDPTFGQFPADAAHIRFVTGTLAEQMEIVRLVGRLGIEVVEGDEAAPAGAASPVDEAAPRPESASAFGARR